MKNILIFNDRQLSETELEEKFDVAAIVGSKIFFIQNVWKIIKVTEKIKYCIAVLEDRNNNDNILNFIKFNLAILDFFFFVCFGD